ncbi:MAG: LptF/LptG family permease [Alphaproteobacteria bacterium]
MRFSWTLSRYFAKNFVTWFGVFMLGVAMLILLFDFSETMRRSASKPHITIDIVTQMVLLQLPYLLQKLLPFIMLFSSMFALWRLNRTNEIVVSKAAGVSIWQLLIPLIGSACLIGLLNVTVFDSITASMMTKYRSLNSEYFHGNKGGIAISNGGIWLRQVDGKNAYVIRIGQVSLEKKQMYDINVIVLDQNDKFLTRFDALGATFVPEGIKLRDVWQTTANQQPEYHEQLSLKSELSLKHIQDNHSPPETMSFWKLPPYIKILDRSGLSSIRYEMHWQTILSNVLLFIGMILLAATCSLKPIRQGGTVLLVALGTAMGFIVYIMRDVTIALGQSSYLPVTMAAWAPAMIATLVGLGILIHQEDS